MKKIILIVFSFLLVIFGVFGFACYKKAYAESYDYDGVIATDTSFATSDYAIRSIESLETNSSLVITLNCYVSGDTYIFYAITKTPRPVGQNLFFGINRIKFNAPGTFISSNGYSLLQSYYHEFGSNMSDYYVNSIEFFDGSFNEYSADSNLLRIYTKGSYKVRIVLQLYNNVYDNEILSTLVDMSSGSSNIDTFYGSNKDYYSNSNYYLPYGLNQYIFNNYSLPNLYVPTNFESVESTVSSVFNNYLYVGDYFNSTNIQFSFGTISSHVSSKTYDFYLGSLEIGVYRPTNRINNTLVLYNYNYSFLNSVGRLNYNMRKGNDYYYIATSGDNGYIPNSYFVYIYNEELNNRIFDEYVTINISGSFGSSTPGYDRSSLFVENGNLYYNLGFDFNFTYYTEPLVSSIGSYNFDFDKPSYVNMKFSLTPFYIPVLEAVENIFIFLVFYCPVISDILALLKLDLFVGGLVSILNYLLGLQIGQFLTGCIAFIIFFVLLKSFMPVVFSSSSKVYEPVKVSKFSDKKKFKKEQQKDLKSNNWSSPFNNKK